MPGLPAGYRRPFDPTLAVLPSGQLRVYFSSSATSMSGGLDSTINTYSAISSDGINFTFEPGARFDHHTNRCIDPAVIKFNSLWHYTCPIGAPQDGAYHATGPDGIIFYQAPDITSDFTHNWTGNFCIVDSAELRFYGSGQPLWYNSTPNGGVWSGYVTTNVSPGGDPTVVRTDDSSYLIIYVGDSTSTINLEETQMKAFRAFPNPFINIITLDLIEEITEIMLRDMTGRICGYYPIISGTRRFSIETADLPQGVYILSSQGRDGSYTHCIMVK
jgi:hypothetical protein